MTTTSPNTTMSRALSNRAIALMAAMPAQPATTPDGLDLTTPETPVVPAQVREAAEAALDRGETHYTTRPGIMPLRDAIARRLTDEGFPATSEGMLITNGGSEALYIALQALLASGNRIIVAGPAAPDIEAMIRFIGAEPVRLAGDREGRFVPSIAAIEAADAKAILIASPSPVTGLAIPPGALDAIIAAAMHHEMTVILDRSLATALYEPSGAQFGNPELGSRVVTIGSFSTGHGLSGWRVGWLATPAEMSKRPRELKQAMSICTTAVSQYAALAILDDPDAWTTTRRNEFARRRDMVIERLRKSSLAIVEPDAFPALLIDVRALDDDDGRFAARLRKETGVVVQPGSTFGPALAGYVRLDLGAPERVLREGVQRLATFATPGSEL